MSKTFFDGDNDDFLRAIQHEEYGASVSLLVYTCRIEYLRAEDILQIKTDLGTKLRETTVFETALFYFIHEVIAAKFRQTCADARQFITDDTEGDSLLSSMKERLRSDWRAYLNRKAKELSGDPFFCKVILQGAIEKNHSFMIKIAEIWSSAFSPCKFNR